MWFLLPGSTMGPVGVGLAEVEVLVVVASWLVVASSSVVVWAVVEGVVEATDEVVVEAIEVVLISSSAEEETTDDALLLELEAEVVCSSMAGPELVGVSTSEVVTTDVVSTELVVSEPLPYLYSWRRIPAPHREARSPGQGNEQSVCFSAGTLPSLRVFPQ